MQLLRRHGRLSAAELARRLEVTKRTVLRDMEALSTAGIPVYAERGRAGGFALLDGFEPDVEQLTSDEARALFLAGGSGTADALGLGSSYGRALEKLAVGLPDDEHRRVAHLQDRIVLDGGSWLHDPRDHDSFDVVQSAVLHDERLRIRYQSMQADRPGERTVDPWGLLQVGGTWYLIAAHRGRPRSYRISRIVAAVALGEPSRRPADLDLRAVWHEMRERFRSTPATEIVIAIHRPRVPLVLRSLAVTMIGDPTKLDDEGTFAVRVRDLDGAAAMLVGFGPDVTVISPDSLRTELVALAERSAAHHRDAPTSA